MVFGFSTFGTIAFWGLIILVFAGLCMGLIIWIVFRKTYNQKVLLWTKIDGRPQKIGEYKAKWKSFGGAGDKLMHVAKVKRWQLPTIRSGANEWNFWLREQDGEWINFGMDDLDEKMNIMKMKFIDGDVRMQRLGIEKVLDKRHQKQANWFQIIANISYVIFFILVFIALIVLFSKLTDVADAQTRTAQATGEMASAVQRFYEGKTGGLSPADIIDDGGSGLVPIDV